MSFLDKMTAFLPMGKKEEQVEYFFALNIGVENLTAALWVISGKELKVLSTASDKYSSEDELISATDKLLDAVLGLKEIEPQKILFGVPNSWVLDDNLKDEHLKTLRVLVKELELAPMAYVTTSNALVHFLEKKEGVPTTAVLVGFEKKHLTVTVVRAGKLDGVKVVARGGSAGADIEKALLTFTDVETLPSKILIYGENVDELKNELLSFSWMSKLSFLHFPKIEALEDSLEIKSVCLAGGSEMNEGIVYKDQQINKSEKPVESEDLKKLSKEEALEELNKSEEAGEPEEPEESEDADTLTHRPASRGESTDTPEEDLGFVVGDVAEQNASESANQSISKSEEQEVEDTDTLTHRNTDTQDELVAPEESALELEDFEQDMQATTEQVKPEKKRFALSKFIPKGSKKLAALVGVIGIIVLFVATYAFLLKADVKIFVEPKILEKDAQVIADPKQKTIDESNKIIPGQIVDTDISGTAKDTATGKKQIGDPAKGTVIVYNKTAGSQTLSKGTQIDVNGVKFTLDTGVTIASQSASDSGITFGKANATVTAAAIGADGNLPTGTAFSVAGFSSDKLNAKSEGNFSGGTSKDVTVVSSEDQQRLLAKLSSDLRKQAQQKLQEKYPNKKILAEALSESIASKSFNKNINDQAGEFSLNLTIRYKGTAFDDADLRTIVSKLVNTQVPDGFLLDLAQTETQADVAKLEKDGRLIFLAKFKAKLMPKIDTNKIKDQIKFKTTAQVTDLLKGIDNVLGSEITTSPALPKMLERMPFLGKNITIEVGLK